MASVPLLRNDLFWIPTCMCLRTMKSVNTRFPKPMHIVRAKLMKVTEMQLPKERKTMAQRCSEQKDHWIKYEHNPAHAFYASIVRRRLTSQRMVAVFHSEPLTLEEEFKLKLRLQKQDIGVKVWGREILKEAVQDNQFQTLLKLYHPSNLYMVSDEPKVKELLKSVKGFPKVHLLGGLIEGKFMSPNQINEYASLPSLDETRGQLVGILTTAVRKTYSLLQSNQQRLVRNLDHYVKDTKE